MDKQELSPSQLKDILRKLAVDRAPAADLAGLKAVYGAWCTRVPFDNLRKMIALLGHKEQPLPGGDCGVFFENWLSHGTGGTCWPTSNALHTLLQSCGFNTRRVAGCMRDLGIINHGSVKVCLQGKDWLTDSSMLTNVPLPLEQDRVHVGSDPVFPAEIESEGNDFILWADMPPNPTYLPCRLTHDPVDHRFYLDAYEQSRGRSPFNDRLYVRRNFPGVMLVILGNRKFVKTAGGIKARDLDEKELLACLESEGGYSPKILKEWADAGGLKASLTAPPASAPKPPPVTKQPPSRRSSG